MARKRSRRSARKRIRDLPDVPIPPVLGKTPLGRAAKGVDIASRELAKVLVRKDPLDRLQPSKFKLFPEIPPEILQGSPPPTRSFGGGGSDRPFDNLERAIMNREKAMQTVINTPEIKMTPQLVDIINDDRMVMLDDGRLAIASMPEASRQFELQNILPAEKKPKRKRSKYNIELTKQLNKLRKERPRTKVIKLMKEAHRRTRKALKK